MNKVSSRSIRAVALCLFLRGREILVFESTDPVKNQRFYRPFGGGIEFGERSVDAVRREIREELGSEIESLRFLASIENIFTYKGEPAHELVYVFAGDLASEELYRQERVEWTEANGLRMCGYWKSLEDFEKGREILYPAGLLELLHGAS